MEYLNSIHDKLKTINEDNIYYLDMLNNPDYFYGNLNFSPTRVDFCKIPQNMQKEMKQFGEGAVREMNNLKSASCGVRLRFHTSSKRLIFKVKLKRKWGYVKMVNWNSFGFDVYELNNGEYIHRIVFAPSDGHDLFAESISVPSNGDLCIFLPNYNTVEEFHLGIDKGSDIHPINYPEGKRLPIVFYGNSVTQGAAASHSGNSFPNIVSKKLNQDILNLSCSSCCRGTESAAEMIGRVNCSSIVIDYTRNAYSTEIFRKTYDKFYRKVREFHPDKKIILLTSANFNHWHDYYDFDKIVEQTYADAIERGENTYLINQTGLFEDDEYSYIAIDTSHYTDYGMFKVADEICKILTK